MGFKKIYIQIMCILLLAVIAFSVYTVMNREETPPVSVSTENRNEIGNGSEMLPLDTETEATEVISSETEQTSETEDEPVEERRTLYANAAVNVRSGPGTTYTALGRLQKGAEVIAVGEVVDGWQKILFEEEVAYVMAEYLSDTPPQEEPSRPNPPSPPDEPDTPDEPDEPDTPDEPDEPDIPDEPDEPVDPEVPEDPVVPDDPVVPEV